MARLDNLDDITHVGPGTPMGELMRRYWVPAALSSEVTTDGPPLRLMLLGEKLIAFRDAQGRVGVMDHRCPHRCASLFLGRNEGDGIRCIYHGWKYDIDGNCVDTPSVPAHQSLVGKVKATAYRAVERAGLIWVYMGDQSNIPRLPALEVTLLPQESIRINIMQRECNWLQALEGDIDTSHVGFLHAGAIDPDDLGEDHPMHHAVYNRAPEYKIEVTEWGTMYGAYRPPHNGMVDWRIAHYVLPFWTMTPNSNIRERVVANAWVPMDDTHTMMIKITGGVGETHNFAYIPMKNGKQMPGTNKHSYLPNTTDWYGRWRCTANPGNDWNIDREAQRKNIIYSGIDSIPVQDQAVIESMGPIVDHTREFLGPGDRMIARTRQAMMDAVRRLRDEGIAPPSARDPGIVWGARSGSFAAPESMDWRQAYREQLTVATRWTDHVGEAAE